VPTWVPTWKSPSFAVESRLSSRLVSEEKERADVWLHSADPNVGDKQLTDFEVTRRDGILEPIIHAGHRWIFTHTYRRPCLRTASGSPETLAWCCPGALSAHAADS
jgi:hypothetical protein